jgi:hypothetical protein
MARRHATRALRRPHATPHLARDGRARGTRGRAVARASRADRRVLHGRPHRTIAVASWRTRAVPRSRAALARSRAGAALPFAVSRRGSAARRARIPRTWPASLLAGRVRPCARSRRPSREPCGWPRRAQSAGIGRHPRTGAQAFAQGSVRQRPMVQKGASARVGDRARRRDRLDSGAVARPDRRACSARRRASRRDAFKPRGDLLDCEGIRALSPRRRRGPHRARRDAHKSSTEAEVS